MRAALFVELGGPDGVDIREVDDPAPGRGEVVLDVGAASLNHHDYWYLKGESRIDDDDLPFLSGVDVAGVVDEIGPGISSFDAGDRVVLNPMDTCGACEYCRDGPENLCTDYGLYHGGFAERALVPADRLIRLPDSVSMTEAAALPVAYMTAWHMIRRAQIAPDDTVLIPGATGGVGVAAIQLLQTVGATTVGTTSSAAKLERLESIGVDEAVHVSSADELEAEVSEFGRYQAVLNHLGGAYTEPALSALAKDGRMVVCGATAGPTSEIDLWNLFLRHKRIIGSTMGTQRDLRRVVNLVSDGAFTPVIDDVYSLDQLRDAFVHMRDRSLFGKLVITP